MKTNAKLHPSWTFIAKKLQCPATQCKARWSEILTLQTVMDNETACHDTDTVAGSTLPQATTKTSPPPSPLADPALPAQPAGLSIPDTLVEAPLHTSTPASVLVGPSNALESPPTPIYSC